MVEKLPKPSEVTVPKLTSPKNNDMTELGSKNEPDKDTLSPGRALRSGTDKNGS